MAAKSGQNSGTSRESLPFEPKAKRAGRKKSGSDGGDSGEKLAAASLKSSQENVSDVSARAQAKADEILASNRQRARKQSGKKADQVNRSQQRRDRTSDSGAIPPEVSNRMLRRMAVLSGSPVFLGVGVFFLAYYLQSHEIVDLPPVAVLLVTMGCFGLGVLGLTYGVLSASWDSEPGSLVGLSEFKLNFSRIMDARRSSKT
ncbi:MAG: DUF3464 family protein [Phormidesmis sp. RL_2_1]|nr:DUF3464 family protein [Phormidesmis sp. RL_2_1]